VQKTRVVGPDVWRECGQLKSQHFKLPTRFARLKVLLDLVKPRKHLVIEGSSLIRQRNDRHGFQVGVVSSNISLCISIFFLRFCADNPMQVKALL
jgi:hypothetical protein